MANLIKIKTGEREFVGVIRVPTDNRLWKTTFNCMLDELLKYKFKDDEVIEFRIYKGKKSICRTFVGIEANLFTEGIKIFYKRHFKSMFHEIILSKGD